MRFIVIQKLPGAPILWSSEPMDLRTALALQGRLSADGVRTDSRFYYAVREA